MTIINAVLLGIALIPGILFRYLPFASNIRKENERKKLIAGYLLIAILTMSIFIFLDYNFEVTPIIFKLIFLLGEIMCFEVNILIRKENSTKRLFVFGTAGVYTLTLHSMAAMVHVTFLPNITVRMQFFFQSILYLFLVALTYRIIVHLIKETIEPFFRVENESYWNAVWTIPFLLFFGDVLLTLKAEWIHTWQQFLSRIITAAAMFATCKCVIYNFEKTKKKIISDERLSALNKQFEIQEKYYDEVVKNIEEIKRAKHDLKYHKQAIKAFVEKNDKDMLMRYYEEEETNETPEDVPITGNNAVDSLLYYYWKEAEKEGIEMKVSCSLPKTLSVSNADLSILFGSAIENAVEACEYIDDGKKFINVLTHVDENQFVLTVDNSFDGKIKKEGEFFLSRKRENARGIGTDAIKAVCEQYDGICKFEVKGKIFMVSVVINMQ